MNEKLSLWLGRGQRGLARLTGFTVFRELPHGVNPWADLDRVVAGWRPKLMFDVGANRGQSAFTFARRYPAAAVVAFEPAVANVAAIGRYMGRFPKIRVEQLALGAAAGEAWLELGAEDFLHRVVEESAVEAGERRGERVRVETLDGYCAGAEIEEVDYLKVDTEGGDLAVLRGAERLLREARIGVIDVEVGVGRDNELHVPMAVMREFLEARGFVLFGFYEQMHEWRRARPHLRRVNLVMIAERWDRAVR